MFLKIYTVFYIAVYLVLVLNPAVIKHYGIWEAIDSAVMATALTGMVAYTFKVRVFIRKFWEYYLYVFVIFELVYMTWLQMPLLEKLGVRSEATINDLFNVCMMLPLAYALFRLQQRWDALFRETGRG